MGNCLKCRDGGSSEDVNQSRERRRGHHEPRRARYQGHLDNDPILHPAPGVSRPMSQLTEEEQVKIATRMGLISTLPLFKFDEGKREKLSECIICMCEYEEGEELRYLPCLHTYHRVCIDDWLMRALTCPSCLEEIKPSSPPIQRTSLRVSAPISTTPVTSTEPGSQGSATVESTALTGVVVNELVNTANAVCDTRYRGDSISTTLPGQSIEFGDRILSGISQSSSEMHGTKAHSSDTANHNGDGSGGDGVRRATTLQPHTIITISPSASQSRRRRTRSNDHGVIRSGSPIFQNRSGHRSERYRRRGNSVSGLDPLPMPASTVAVTESAVVTEPFTPLQPTAVTLVTSPDTVSRLPPETDSAHLWPHQLNGDSDQP